MINNFSDEKRILLNKLINLKSSIDRIQKELQLNLSDIMDKINRSIINLEKERFSIAFFGAFSDGKSTILSALIQKLDIEISPEPTTDEIKTYEYEDYFIIDTPGLFSEHLLHSEKTKKYISEANVIIYTIDAVNPLKESHHATVKWLLQDLSKIDSVIFVLNKMDEVADIEDEKDFQKNYKIKRQVVIDTLKEITELADLDNINIVGISADPFGLGLSHWFSKPNYKELSRLDILIKTINNFIDKSKNELIIKAGLSVIKDTIQKILTNIQDIIDKVKDEIELLDKQIHEWDDKISTFEKDIGRKYNIIQKEIINFRQDTISYVMASIDVSDLRNRINSRIGKEGYILKQQIDLVVQKYTEDLLNEQSNMIKDIESSVNFHSEIQKKLLDATSKGCSELSKKILEKTTKELSKIIKDTRDITKLPIKFKPWETLKWAEKLKSFAKFLNSLPIIVEALSIVVAIYNKWKFDNEKDKIITEIDLLFKAFTDTFTLENYIQNYFSNIADFKNIRANLSRTKDNYSKVLEEAEKSMYEMKNLNI